MKINIKDLAAIIDATFEINFDFDEPRIKSKRNNYSEWIAFKERYPCYYVDFHAALMILKDNHNDKTAAY